MVSALHRYLSQVGVEFVPVDSALSMQHAVESRYDELDVVIMAAAVSDFRVPSQGRAKNKEMESRP